jgi:hypothetical protein
MFALNEPLDRRDFIRLGGLVLAGQAFGPLAASATGSGSRRRGARSCILVYLLGGPPQLDTFDLKPDAPAEVRGPFRPIATAVPGLRICEHLPRLARLARHYALVRTVSHNNHNHTPMIYYTLTGRPVERPGEDNDVRPPQRTDFPHLGAVLARLKGAPRDLPGYVAIPELAVRSSIRGEFRRVRQLLRGGGAGFLGPLLDPLAVNGEPGGADAIPALMPPAQIDDERQQRRSSLLSVINQRGPALRSSRVMDSLQRQAVTLSGSRGGKTFALDGEPSRVQDRYGRHRFGKALLLARRLAEAGVPMIAIHFNEMTVCDGWDTHTKEHFPALKNELLPMVDQGLSALLEDLQQRGLAGETVVVMMGEFGRTPRINAAAGRDHWGLCQSVLLAGSGIKGGQVVGTSDRIGAYPANDPFDPVDIHATVYHVMGLNPAAHLRDHLDRPWPLSTGKVVSRLV